jgi:hypothetical protein
MKSIGLKAQQDIKVIESVFRHCAQLIRHHMANSLKPCFPDVPFRPIAMTGMTISKELLTKHSLILSNRETTSCFRRQTVTGNGWREFWT